MPATIKKGDRIAQAEVVCNVPISIVKLNSMPDKYSERSDGFGSTGVSVEAEKKDWEVDGPTNFA